MVWKELERLDAHDGYRLAPLRRHLTVPARELKQEVRSDREAILRSNREGFYEVVMASAWYLLHVSDALRTVYLVAHAPIGGIGSGGAHRIPSNVVVPA